MRVSRRLAAVGFVWGVGVFVMVLLAACSVVTAPLRLPGVVAKNANFSPDLVVVDQDGKALEGVLLTQHLSHKLMQADGSVHDTDENKARMVGGEFSVRERGTVLDLTFSKEGYYEAKYAMHASGPEVMHVRYPYMDASWPVAGRFPIVLVSRDKPDANLRFWIGYGGLNMERDMRSQPLFLAALWGPEATVEDNPHHTTNVFVPARPRVADGRTITTRMVELFMNSGSPEETVVERFRPGTFYVTAVAQAPRPINARGEIDPAEIDLPGQVTLHLTGQDVGFQRIVPRAGYLTIPLADRAPTTGYVSELVIDRKRLKEMRIAGAGIDHTVCFFLKVDGRYGKGQISWSNLLDPKNPKQLGTSFNVSFWMQSEAGNADLTWHEAFRR